MNAKDAKSAKEMPEEEIAACAFAIKIQDVTITLPITPEWACGPECGEPGNLFRLTESEVNWCNLKMAISNVFVEEWPRKLAVWLAITTLVPMVAYFGAAALFTPPDEEAYNTAHTSLTDQAANGSSDEKAAARAKLDQLDKQHLETGRSFARRLFWVSYAAGIISVAIGLFAPIQPVGAGLMFGGIISISEGCYNAWDHLGRWPRFGSLLFALVFFLLLSLLRFRARPASAA